MVERWSRTIIEDNQRPRVQSSQEAAPSFRTLCCIFYSVHEEISQFGIRSDKSFSEKMASVISVEIRSISGRDAAPLLVVDVHWMVVEASEEEVSVPSLQ